MTSKSKPRQGPYAEMPGSYEQAIRVKTPIIDPGDPLKIEQFFTGYGEIKWAKMTFYPSDDVFEKDLSWVLSGMDMKDPTKVKFGNQKFDLKDTGVTIAFTGLLREGWDEPTLFFDIEPKGIGVPQILMERKFGEAPVSYLLKTKKTIKPGTYTLEFYFTYYDGKGWRSNSKKADFKVRNVLERNAVQIGIFAFFATTLGVLKLLLGPLIPYILDK